MALIYRKPGDWKYSKNFMVSTFIHMSTLSKLHPDAAPITPVFYTAQKKVYSW